MLAVLLMGSDVQMGIPGWPTMRLLVLLAVVMLPCGCGGWQLRGLAAADADLSRLRWRTGDTSAAMGEVLDVLRRAGMQPAQEDQGSDLVVNLLSLAESRRSVSVTSQARTAEYELLSSLSFSVTDATGRQLVDGAPLTERRDYALDRDNIMGSSGEEEQLRREMRRQLGQSLVRTLAAVVPGGGP